MSGIKFFQGSMVAFGISVIVLLIERTPWLWLNAAIVFVISMVGGMLYLRSHQIREERRGETWQFNAVNVGRREHMLKRDVDRFRHELLPGENHIKWITRKSRIALVPPAILLSVAIFFFVAAAVIGDVQPSTWKLKQEGSSISDLRKALEPPTETRTPTPKSSNRKETKSERKAKKRKKTEKAKKAKPKAAPKKVASPPASYPAWIIPFGFAVSLFFAAMLMIVIWRASVVIITNLHLINARKPPSYLPFIPEMFDRESLAMIADTDPHDTFFSRLVGFGSWGSVIVLINRIVGNEPEKLTLPHIPHYKEFNRVLRDSARESGGLGAVREHIVEEELDET